MSDIQLQISGKQIDTVPIINLLRQGENNADTILMQLPPKYGDIALDGLTYIMYGDSKGGKSGTRVSQTLEKEINGEGVLLRWKISDDFTAVAGELKLMLKGFCRTVTPSSNGWAAQSTYTATQPEERYRHRHLSLSRH